MAPQASIKYPLTEAQKKEKRDSFIASIDVNAVRRLASSHNDSKLCHVFREPANGSFNVCFFVEFEDQTQWVVRFPIAANVYDPWEKIQSEVATIRYLRNKTKIPVPQVFAFGPQTAPGAGNPTGLAYMIVDYVPGTALDVVSLEREPKERKRHFYSQLIDILAELNQQKFKQAGSLTFDPDGGEEPVVGPLVSMQLNELRVQRGEAVIPSTRFHSAIDFVSYQYRILDEKFKAPAQQMELREAWREVFALYDVKNRLDSCIRPDDNHGPFVLNHYDLRWSNIIIDKNLNIKGIIDWEWAAIIPRQLFSPPFWIAGRPVEDVNGALYLIEYCYNFHKVLMAKAEMSPAYRSLAEAWPRRLPSTLEFSMAFLLRHHNSLIDLYYQGVFRKCYKDNADVVMAQFFDLQGEDSVFARDAKWRVNITKEYQQYLRNNDVSRDAELNKKGHGILH